MEWVRPVRYGLALILRSFARGPDYSIWTMKKIIKSDSRLLDVTPLRQWYGRSI